GEAEGREAGREAFLRVSAAFREGLEQLNRLREDILRENEEHLAAVAVAVAERVIHREVQTDPGVVRSVVRAALAAAAELDEVTVALHADDVELIREEAEDLVAAFDHLRNLHLAAEPGIERGGCIVRTPCGDVEARIPMQFDAIVEALRSALPNFTEPG
ncbi:MAG: FliH/SctL family protein, partial [Nitrospinota bacterium]